MKLVRNENVIAVHFELGRRDIKASPCGLTRECNGVVACVSAAHLSSFLAPNRFGDTVVARGLALVGNSVFVAPLLSGNGTAPRGNPNTYDNDVLDVQIVGNNGFPGIALPDYDLLRIDLGGSPENDQLNLPATIRGMGTK